MTRALVVLVVATGHAPAARSQPGEAQTAEDELAPVPPPPGSEPQIAPHPPAAPPAPQPAPPAAAPPPVAGTPAQPARPTPSAAGERPLPPPPQEGARAGISLAVAMGGGKRFEPAADREPLFDGALRLDVLFGPANPEARWAVGPAFELRTADFDTLEVAGAAHLRVGLGGPMSLWWTVGGGKSYLPDAREGGLVATTLGIGARLRGYRHECHGPVCYEPRFGAYVSYREGVGGRNQIREVTGGFEVDIAVVGLILAVIARVGG